MKLPAQLIATLFMTLFAVSSVAANDPASGCKPLGSWIGYDQTGLAWWMTTTDGQNASHGTLNMEVPGALAFFPGATGVTELRGVWEKTGDNEVAWTVVGFAFDASGTTLALARVSGKHSSSQDCNTETITDTLLEVFAPDADVDTDIPLWTLDFPTHLGHRVELVTFDQP